MKSLCLKCKIATNQNVLHEEVFDDDDESYGFWSQVKYQIIKCFGCDSISFRRLYTDSEDEQIANYRGTDIWTQKLYPELIQEPTYKTKQFTNLPKNIENVYIETISAFNNGEFLLSAAGLRAVIEGICKDKKEKQYDKSYHNSLEKDIDSLTQNGFISKNNSATLHELRFLGNAALHELSPPSEKELEIAINIIEHTLENLYELHSKTETLKQETQKRKGEI